MSYLIELNRARHLAGMKPLSEEQSKLVEAKKRAPDIIDKKLAEFEKKLKDLNKGKSRGDQEYLDDAEEKVQKAYYFASSATDDDGSYPANQKPKSGPQLHWDNVPSGQDGKGIILVADKGKINVGIVNDYHDPKDAKQDKNFADSEDGYHDAIMYFYELSKKL